MRTHPGILPLLSMGLLLAAAPVAAGSTPDLLDMSLEQLMRLPITASTLTDESRKSVPSAVTVFHHSQIEGLGVDYLHELLDFVPGYQPQHSADNAYAFTYSARGRRNSTEAREILLLLDGRVLSDPHTGSADAAFPLVPLANLERVEIIRGPGSALYGSSAFTGVINLVSREGVREAAITGGSHGHRDGRLQWSAQSGHWQLDLFAHGRRDRGQIHNVPDSFGPGRVDTRDPLRNQDIDLALRRGGTVFRAAAHRAQALDFYAVENVANGFNRFESRLEQASVEQEQRLRNGLSLRLFGGYVRTRHDFNLQLLPDGALLAVSAPSSADPLRVMGVLEAEAWDLKLEAEQPLSGNNRLRAGLSWRQERDTDTSAANNFDLADLAAGTVPIRYYGDFNRRSAIGREQSRDSVGVYGQWQHDLSAATRLTMGLRFDDYRAAGSRLSPRFGLVRQLGTAHTLKLLYGEAFQAPSLNETGLINNALLVGNPDLKHQTVKTWDLIWLGTWDNITGGVTLFRNRYRDPITTALAGHTRTFVNGASEESQGMEWEAGWQPDPQWLFQTTLTRLARVPDSAFREATQLGSVIVNYRQAAWNINLAGSYQGPRDMLVGNNTRQPLPGVWRVNAKLRYRVTPHGETYLQIRNLFNTDVVTPPQGNVMPEGVPGRGREVTVGGVISF